MVGIKRAGVEFLYHGIKIFGHVRYLRLRQVIGAHTSDELVHPAGVGTL